MEKGSIEPGALQVRLLELDLAEIGILKVGPLEVCSLEIGRQEVGRLKIRPLQVSLFQVGKNKAGPLKFCLVEIGSLKIGAVETGIAEILTVQVSSRTFGVGLDLATGSHLLRKDGGGQHENKQGHGHCFNHGMLLNVGLVAIDSAHEDNEGRLYCQAPCLIKVSINPAELLSGSIQALLSAS